MLVVVVVATTNRTLFSHSVEDRGGCLTEWYQPTTLYPWSSEETFALIFTLLSESLDPVKHLARPCLLRTCQLCVSMCLESV